MNTWFKKIPSVLLFLMSSLVIGACTTKQSVEAPTAHLRDPSGLFQSSETEQRDRARKDLLLFAQNQKGKPYQWNKDGPDAFDCSGFVFYVLKTSLGPAHFALDYDLSKLKGYTNQSIYLRDQLAQAKAEVSCDNSHPGDIVFFPALGQDPNHIGIITVINGPAKSFITAQGKTVGVKTYPFGLGTYWIKRKPVCYRNIWL